MKTAYEAVTERILAKMEKGEIPWHKPWKSNGGSFTSLGICNGMTGRVYNLSNQFLLGQMAEDDYTNVYYTHKQILELGGLVKKGEHARPVVFWKLYVQGQKGEPTQEEIDEAKENGKLFPILRYYNVFNSAQCEGLPESKYLIKKDEEKEKQEDRPVFEKCEDAESIIAGYVENGGPRVDRNSNGDKAYYRPSADMVVIPKASFFTERPEYYSTVFHELGHSTGHETRLHRDLRNFFGTEKYAKEELVAELCAAFLCGEVGISCDSQETNSAAYLQGWSKAIKEDVKLFPNAAFAAMKAAEWILKATARKDEDEVEEGDETVTAVKAVEAQSRQISFL